MAHLTDQAKVAEDILLASQAGARVIGAKLLDNTTANASAVFDNAAALARARGIGPLPPEFTRHRLNIRGDRNHLAHRDRKIAVTASSRAKRDVHVQVPILHYTEPDAVMCATAADSRTAPVKST